MPAVLIAVIGAIASSLLAKVLLGAGLAIVSYVWINDLVALAQTEMQGMFYNLPADLVGLLGILKIPQALSVLMSAIGTATFIKSAKVFVGKV